MKKVPVYWGNREWLENDEGLLVPSTPLEKTDPKWIDYTKVSGTQTSALISDAHPQRQLRLQLRNQICEATLFGAEKFVSDKPICLLTHGGIASGKTSAIELFLMSSEVQYLHVDFDRMKKQIPEFVFMQANGIKDAGEHTRTESSSLAAKSFKRAIKRKLNVIYEGSLAETKAIKERILEMRDQGFSIGLVSTHVTEARGQERAIKRFEKGGRSVPPETIRKTYQNCPKTFVELIPLADDVVLIDNELEGQPGRIILSSTGQGEQEIDEGLYIQYLQCVGAAFDLKDALAQRKAH